MLLFIGLTLLVNNHAYAEQTRSETMQRTKQAVERLISESSVSTVSVAMHDLETNRQILFQPDVSYHPDE